MGLNSAYRQRAAKADERERQMSETHHDPFAEFYRRRIDELQAAMCEAQTVEEMEKIQRELDPYLKEIGKDEK